MDNKCITLIVGFVVRFLTQVPMLLHPGTDLGFEWHWIHPRLQDWPPHPPTGQQGDITLVKANQWRVQVLLG